MVVTYILANDLENRVRSLEDEFTRFKRDNEDAMNNIDMSNLGSELTRLLRSIQSRINALES